MIVQSIRKERGMAVIDLGSETIRIAWADLQGLPIREGGEVDMDQLDQSLLERQYRPALEYAVSLMASRPYAEKELEERLRRRGYRPRTVEMVLFKLNHHELLDDEAFARQWTQARTGRNMGSRRIAQELRRKGVDTDIIDQVLEEIDPEQNLLNAVNLVKRSLNRGRPEEDPRKTAQRLISMLVRRGFDFDTAREALSIARSDLEMEGED